MSYESFNIRPGMSCWVDMPEGYKNAYYEKFPLAKFGDGTPVQWRSEPEEEIFETPVSDEQADWRAKPKAEEVEPNEVSDEPDWRSPTVTFAEQEVIELVEEVGDCTCGPDDGCNFCSEPEVVENPCPVCGNELPKGKKYCTRQCFYDRNK